MNNRQPAYKAVPRFGLAEPEAPMIYNMHVRGAKSSKRNPYNTRYVAELIKKVDEACPNT